MDLKSLWEAAKIVEAESMSTTLSSNTAKKPNKLSNTSKHLPDFMMGSSCKPPQPNSATSMRKSNLHRMNHNNLEKCRRAYLRDCLNGLRAFIPKSAGCAKSTTLSLLLTAKDYVKSLQKHEDDLWCSIKIAYKRLDFQRKRLTRIISSMRDDHKDVTFMETSSSCDSSGEIPTVYSASCIRDKGISSGNPTSSESSSNYAPQNKNLNTSSDPPPSKNTTIKYKNCSFANEPQQTKRNMRYVPYSSSFTYPNRRSSSTIYSDDLPPSMVSNHYLNNFNQFDDDTNDHLYYSYDRSSSNCSSMLESHNCNSCNGSGLYNDGVCVHCLSSSSCSSTSSFQSSDSTSNARATSSDSAMEIEHSTRSNQKILHEENNESFSLKQYSVEKCDLPSQDHFEDKESIDIMRRENIKGTAIISSIQKLKPRGNNSSMRHSSFTIGMPNSNNNLSSSVTSLVTHSAEKNKSVFSSKAPENLFHMPTKTTRNWLENGNNRVTCPL